MKSSLSLPLISLAACLIAQPPASAGPVSPGGVDLIPPLVIPPPSGTYDLTVCDQNKLYCSGGTNTTVSFSRSTSSSQTVTDGSSSATEHMNIQPQAKASATLKTTAGSTANVILVYFFGVSARDGATPAPITISASGNASTSGDSMASASVQVQQRGGQLGQLFSYTACTAPCFSNFPVQPSFNASKKIFIAPNTVYSVVMSIDLTVDGVNGQTGLGQASAAVDPIITVDPEYASGYRLVLSRNVGNVLGGRRK
jgi:hypothetical protein